MTTNTILGGAQSPKSLLDAVIDAVKRRDIGVLRELKGEFLEVAGNLEKALDGSGNNLVHLAIDKDIATLRYVVEEYQAEIDALNQHGKTPLHEAVKGNLVASVQYLLDHGAKEVSSHTLSSPLHTAAACGSVECLNLLLRHGEALGQKDKVNEADRAKQTALHKCSIEGDRRVAEWLIARGANVNAVDVDGCTPLMAAVKLGRNEIVDLLLAKGADPKVRDVAGNTSVHLCASRCLPKIAASLVEAGCPVTAYNEEGNTPLHLATLHQRPEAAEWEELVLFLVQHSDEAVLTTANGSSKLPRDYVGRALVGLLSKDEVKRREAEKRKAARSESDRVREQQELLQQKIAERKAALQEAERARKEEEERLQREAEERVRAEDDARVRMEEEAEQRAREEEEARKAKKKGKGKGKGKK